MREGLVGALALFLDFFGGLVDGDVGAFVLPESLGLGPENGVVNDLFDRVEVVSGVGFVSGAEVKYLAVASVVAVTAAEDFAAFEPGDEYLFVGSGDAKGFAVHFLHVDFEIAVDAFRNGVAGVGYPEAFLFASFAPAEGTGGAHEAFENLGEVAGMEDDEAHAFEDSCLDAVDDFVVHLIVGAVAPPGEDVGVFEAFFSEAVFGFLQGGGGHIEACVGVFFA